MLSRFSTQLTTLLSLLPANFLVGLLPICIVWLVGRHDADDRVVVNKRNRVFSLLIHFGGGVFLSTCFLILIPESQERFLNHDATEEASQVQDDGHHHDAFPIPEFIVLCGFFGTFAIEEIIKGFILLCRRKRVKQDPRVRFCSCAKRHTECSRTFKADNPEQTIFGLEKQMFLDSHAASTEGDSSILIRSGEKAANPKTSLLQSSIIAQAVPSYGSVTTLLDPPTNEPLSVIAPPVLIENDGKMTIINPQPTLPLSTDKTSNILLLIALSVYGVIQGISLGEMIGYSSWESVLVNSLQQAVLVFVIGSVAIPESNTLWPVISYVSPLSVMYSFGICITAYFEKQVNCIPNTIWGGLISAVCGSLLYLIFCDLFRRENVRKMCGREKFLGFTLGAAIVALLLYLQHIL